MEISFFVEAGALLKLNPTLRDAEAGFLEAFDAARERIHAVADAVYVRSPKRANAYVLAAEDF